MSCGAPARLLVPLGPDRPVVNLTSLGAPDKPEVSLTSLGCPWQAPGAPARPVVPLAGLWCPWRACGAPDKPVVPLLGLWYVHIQAYGKIMKCVLLRSKESKPPNPFRIMTDYLICNDSGAIYCQGHREESSEVK